MTEANPRPKVPEQVARPSGRKDYPVKRVTVSTRPVISPDGGTSPIEDQPVSRYIMSPSDLTRARELYIDILAGLRRTRGIGTNYEHELAEIMRADRSVFSDFRLGLTEAPDMSTIIQALQVYVDPDDPRLVELRELQPPEDTTQAQVAEEARETMPSDPEEMRWLRTLTRPGITLQSALRYLRLSVGLSQGEFADKTDRHENSIKENEREVNPKLPSFSDLSEMIKATGLDVDGKPAQLLRLLTEKQPVKSLNETCTVGELVKYLRIVRGLTQVEVATQLGVTRGVVIGIENGKQKAISNRTQNALITWLDIPSNSALSTIITRKGGFTTDTIPPEILQELFRERYLFQEHLEIPVSSLSTDEMKLLTFLQKTNSLIEKVKLLNQTEKEDREVQEKFWSRHRYTDYVRRLEQGHFSALQEHRFVRFLMVHGYDIHHPITWHMLDFLQAQKRTKSVDNTDSD